MRPPSSSRSIFGCANSFWPRARSRSMRPWRQCSIPAAAAPRKDTSGPSPVTTGRGAGRTRLPSPTATLRVAARSTPSSCSSTIAASCNATDMPPTRALPTQHAAITLAFCWAHLRRRFFDIAKDGSAPIASEALERIAALYAIEKTIRGHTAFERRAVRQEQSKPLVLELKRWFEQQLARVSGKSLIAEAIRYGLNHWDGLTRFLDDGRIELDTNIVERSIRPMVLNRKNALFAGHDQGAENWACIASLIETCKLHGVDPQAYFADVLTKLVNLWPASRLDELMPWAWAAERSSNKLAA